MSVDGSRLRKVGHFLLDHSKTIIAIIGILIAYGTFQVGLYAQVKENTIEINSIKADIERKEIIDREFRAEFRRNQSQIQSQLSKTNEKLDKLIDLKIQELQRSTGRR